MTEADGEQDAKDGFLRYFTGFVRSLPCCYQCKRMGILGRSPALFTLTDCMKLIALGFFMSSIALLAGNLPTGTDDSELGRRLVAQYRQEIGIGSSRETDTIQAYLQKLVDRLVLALPRKGRYTVVYDPNPAFKSAFALPGDYVVVGGGILAIAGTEDEVANVIAHEIEHSELHQVEERTSEIEKRQHLSAQQLKVSMYYGHYTKSQEMSCDRNGAQLAQKAGFSPSGMLTLLETFQALRKGQPEIPSMDSPTLGERIQQMHSVFAANELKSGIPEKPLSLP